MKKICVMCGGEFDAYKGVVTCSAACGHARRAETCNRHRASKKTAKQCISCGCSFYTSSGWRGRVRTCSVKCSDALKAARRSVYYPAWRLRNAEKLKEKSHEGYVQNRESHLENCREYYRRNKDQVAARNRAWKEANSERYWKYKAGWYQENKAEIAERAAAYQLMNYETRRTQRKAYRQQNIDCISAKKRRETEEKTAAAKLVRLLAKYGLAALNEGFVEPPPSEDILKRRAAGRRYDERNPSRRKRTPEKVKESNQRSAAKRRAAAKLIREFQSKGLEALL